jgi:succinate dehydrogenase hydrophobic anchor subunit
VTTTHAGEDVASSATGDGVPPGEPGSPSDRVPPPDEAGTDDGPPAVEQPWWWHLMRATGLALLVLVPVQFALTRLAEDPGRLTVPLARERWDTNAFRVLDLAVVVCAALHAVTACVAVLDRSRLSTALRTVLLALVAVVAAAAVGFTGFLVGPG